jgi:glycosyltransferase involved in cell wall biosynthesis
MANAWCLIMPSFIEGGGSFPMEEALSSGISVACSGIPVMREHLGERSAKVAFFDPYCPQSITASLEDILSNHSEYKQSVLAGRTDTRPSWESIARQYSVFQNALAI